MVANQGLQMASQAVVRHLPGTVEAISVDKSHGIDVLDYLRQPGKLDAIVCNLFLHHLDADVLSDVLALAAERAPLFVACEPRRARIALQVPGMVGQIGQQQDDLAVRAPRGQHKRDERIERPVALREAAEAAPAECQEGAGFNFVVGLIHGRNPLTIPIQDQTPKSLELRRNSALFRAMLGRAALIL